MELNEGSDTVTDLTSNGKITEPLMEPVGVLKLQINIAMINTATDSVYVDLLDVSIIQNDTRICNGESIVIAVDALK